VRDRLIGFLSRLAGLLVQLLLVLFLGFVLFRLIPGDPVRAITRGHPTTPQQIAALRQELDLDRPLPIQFGSYLADAVQGDLGNSIAYRRPVSALIAERLGPTALLTGVATALSILIGWSLGIRAGWRRGSRFDRWSTATALASWSAPTFWLGLILLVCLGGGVGPIPGLFPVVGMRSPGGDTGLPATVIDVGWHLILPCLTLIAVQYGQYHLLIRSSLIAQRSEGYLKLARAKGLREADVRRQVVPNVAGPTLTLAMLNLGLLVSGAVAVETVFTWPGLGYLTYQALQVHDLPVLHGTFLIFSAVVIIANSTAKLIHARLDPRLRPGQPPAGWHNHRRRRRREGSPIRAETGTTRLGR
jgi:peptide/nickel transport system permease protein